MIKDIFKRKSKKIYMKTKKFDLIVIGGGSGNKIARPSAHLGLKTALIEKEKLGGTCLNRGCIPSKMLIMPADTMTLINNSAKYSIKVEKPILNLKKLTDEIYKKTNNISEQIEEKFTSGDIKKLTFYKGEAKFVNDNIIEINGEYITAKKIVIGIGARPNIPNIKGLDKTPYITSKQALNLKKLPKKLIVIGGGYIGMELGVAYQGMGSEVTFLERNQILQKVDFQIRDEFRKELVKKNKLIENFEFEEVKYDKKEKQFKVFIKKENKILELNSDCLLVATGVKINTDSLNLQNTSLKLNKNGSFKVNKKLQTNVKHIFAIGDCAGNYMFRHSANFEAEYLLENLIKKNVEIPKKNIVYPPMPWAIFTNPQIAGVGLTENEAIEKNIGYIVGINEYKNSAMGDALRSSCGMVKLIFEKKTQKLIGAHIFGEEASNMIHILITAMAFNAVLNDLLEKMIFIHPALPENIRNALRSAQKKL